MIVLVLNCGSSSLRFQLIDADARTTRVEGLVERIGAVSSLARIELFDPPAESGGPSARQPGTTEREALSAADHGEALRWVLDRLTSSTEGEEPIVPLEAIEAVGHRVVHGGEQFADSVLIDEEVLEAIREAFDLAPLHNPANLQGILAARARLPEVPHVAVFDTAFHQTLPEEAYLYALPQRLYRRYKLRRYGFHGTSHYYVSRRLYEVSGIPKDRSRVITCHLGNGASMAAIRDGASVDTSMGLTPLPGLVMGTRCGDIDPSVVFFLVEKEELSLAEVHSLLNRHSGLLGVSGFASDMRDLLEEAEAGDPSCRRAIDLFCYRIKGYLGQYHAVLGGLDAVVFTAGIGENSPEIRRRALEGLGCLGIELDPEANAAARGTETRISTDDSPTQVWVIPTDEELVIAIDAWKIAKTARRTPWV